MHETTNAPAPDMVEKPKPKRRVPSVATLEKWMDRGGCKATDGCWVEPDGTCQHGKRSWLLVMGTI